MALTNKAAYVESTRLMLAWDFDRAIVGHGTPILVDGKTTLRAAIQSAGIKL